MKKNNIYPNKTQCLSACEKKKKKRRSGWQSQGMAEVNNLLNQFFWSICDGNNTQDNYLGPHTSVHLFDGINIKVCLPCYLYIPYIFLSLIDSSLLNLARILQSSICWNVLQNLFSDGSNDLQSKIKWTASALAMIYTWALPNWAFQMQFTFSHSQIKFNPASGPYVFDVRIYNEKFI